MEGVVDGRDARRGVEDCEGKYPHPINHYEEYEDCFVFDSDDGTEHVGGTRSPIVIRKSDMAALNFDPAFFWGLDADAENAGDVLAEGEVA